MTPAQQPVKPSESEAAVPVPPADPFERAQKDPAYRQEFAARLKEEWSRTIASNEWVQSRELLYWQSEMRRETEMFEHTLKYLDAEEAKLRGEHGADQGPIGHHTDRADSESAFQSLHHRQQSCDISDVSRPHLAANRATSTVENHPPRSSASNPDSYLYCGRIGRGFLPRCPRSRGWWYRRTPNPGY